MTASTQTLLRTARRLGIPVDLEHARRSGRLHVHTQSGRRVELELAGATLNVLTPYPTASVSSRVLRFERPGAGRSRGRVLSGDPRFDGRVWAYGDRAQVCAVLSEPSRARLRALFSIPVVRSISVRSNRISLSLNDAKDARAMVFCAVVLEVLQWVTLCMNAPVAPFARALKNALNDTEPRVQALNARLLFQRLDSEPRELQIEALLALAERVELRPWLRCEALGLLCALVRPWRGAASSGAPGVDRITPAELIFRARGLLSTHPQVAMAAAELLVELDDRQIGKNLAKLVERSCELQLRRLAPQLERIRDPRCEAALIARARCGERRAREFAIGLLAKVGGPAALAPLRTIAGGPLAPRSIRSAAQKAAKAIMSRGSVGGLSFAEGGELSPSVVGALAFERSDAQTDLAPR